MSHIYSEEHRELQQRFDATRVADLMEEGLVHDERYDAPELADFPEAQRIVAIDIESIWVNCPRYIHRYQRVEPSKYVPEAGQDTPIPAWKRVDFVQPALPQPDQGRAANAGGLITLDEYETLVAKGDA